MHNLCQKKYFKLTRLNVSDIGLRLPSHLIGSRHLLVQFCAALYGMATPNWRTEGLGWGFCPIELSRFGLLFLEFLDSNVRG